ncbi:SusC/RagA family TonB-linked outer membrane protein [Bacteroides sedimenti]|uniref:SusC/RagA family TonB-linked outer membrane protein n=1 Tax=Bacteroides sedimenti TaxID=2136147 RepID=A0ABM8I8E3_9BACE
MKKWKESFRTFQHFKAGLLLMLMSLSAMAVYAQSGTVKGTVFDENGEPFIGVSVAEKGTKNGTITDIDGKYAISVRDLKNAVLKFSFIGHETIEEAVKGRKVIDVKITTSVTVLNEVVAIGYGNVKKRDLTGSIASVKSEDILRTAPATINQALQGKIAGVLVSQSDGAPGAGISIQIRGANSFTTSAEPLYVIDGVPFNTGNAPDTDYATKQTNNPLSLINPRDVKSIEVLKDASATAIYGSRGANGVILITTKNGSEGRTKIELSANYGVSKPVKLIEVLNASEYAQFRNEETIMGYKYDGKDYVSDESLPFPIPGRWTFEKLKDPNTGQIVNVDSTYLPSPQDFANGYMNNGTDWQKQIYQTAFSQDYNLSLSGGDKKGQYMLSMGMLDQQGIILKSYFKRYTVRSNINRKVTDWFEIGNNLTASKSLNRMARTNTETYGIVNDAIGFNPTRNIYDPDQPSGYSEDFSNGLSNPYLYVRTAKNLLESMNLYNSTYATITFNKHLNFRQNLGYGYSQSKRNQYYNRYISGGVAPTNGYASQADDYYESVTTESLLSFNMDINKAHHVDAVAGWSYENVNWGGKSMSGSGFANDLNEENNMYAAIVQNKNYSNKGKTSLMSYLGRVNYILLDKYLLTASFRRDGSSRLANHRWSNFASGAVAWRLSEEKFIKNLNIFDNLKLRFSYGQTGNQSVNAYATRSRFTVQQYPVNGALTNGFAEDRWGGPAAPNLKWETTDQYNIGMDVGFFDNRVNFVFDVYRKKTHDLLQYVYTDMSSGFLSMASNYGNVQNEGLEISGNFLIVKDRDFTWRMDANMSFNRNKVGGLNSDQFSDVCWGLESMFLRRNGEPIGVIYGYQEDGYFDNEAEVRANPLYKNESDAKIKSMIGQVKYKDNNGDGIIDNKDKAIIGNTNPDFTYGITNTITYKDFILSFFLQGTKGNDILNVNMKNYDMASTTNMPKFVWDNRWTESNRENAQFPRADITYTRSLKASDRFVENGEYLRMKNVSLTYRFNNPIKEIEAVNLTFAVNNLFTITKYRWYDPDVNTFGSDTSRRGVDMDSYPSARTFNLGIQVTF